MSLIKPQRDQVYTLHQIFTTLFLRDSPHLGLTVLLDGVEVTSVIQESHCDSSELLAVPGLAESRWTYLRTTEEWIPLFRHAGTVDDAMKFVDVERENASAYDIAKHGPSKEAWVTPKGLPCKQYYD